MFTTASLDGITITAPTTETLPSFARLTCTLLPIAYSPNFFDAVLNPPSAANGWSLARIAIWNDPSVRAPENDTSKQQPGTTFSSNGQVVAGIYGRIQPVPMENPVAGFAECQLYIATLAVLAPWRGRGIATVLLDHITRAAIEVVQATQATQHSSLGSSLSNSGITQLGNLTSVCAHVWETNDDGLLWYQARGFEGGDIIKGYYRKLRPDGARLVRRRVLDFMMDGQKREIPGRGEMKMLQK